MVSFGKSLGGRVTSGNRFQYGFGGGMRRNQYSFGGTIDEGGNKRERRTY